MRRKIFSRKGQNLAEYALIFSVIIAAAAGITALIREGIQDRVISEVRKLRDDKPSEQGAAFDLFSQVSRNTTSNESIDVLEGGEVQESEKVSGTTSSELRYDIGN